VYGEYQWLKAFIAHLKSLGFPLDINHHGSDMIGWDNEKQKAYVYGIFSDTFRINMHPSDDGSYSSEQHSEPTDEIPERFDVLRRPWDIQVGEIVGLRSEVEHVEEFDEEGEEHVQPKEKVTVLSFSLRPKKVTEVDGKTFYRYDTFALIRFEDGLEKWVEEYDLWRLDDTQFTFPPFSET